MNLKLEVNHHKHFRACQADNNKQQRYAAIPARYLTSPFPTRASLSGKHSKMYTRFHVPIPRECWEEILASLVEMRTSWHRQTPSVPLFADPAVISCHYHQKQISFMQKKKGTSHFPPTTLFFLFPLSPLSAFFGLYLLPVWEGRKKPQEKYANERRADVI